MCTNLKYVDGIAESPIDYCHVVFPQPPTEFLYVLGHYVIEDRGIVVFSNIWPHYTHYVASGGYDHHWFDEVSVFVNA